MVEQNPVAGVQAVGFAVVDRDPVRKDLGAGVGASRIKGRPLRLRRLLRLAEHLAGGGLVKPRAECPSPVWPPAGAPCPVATMSAVYSGLSKLTRTWLCDGQVVNLLRLHLADQPRQRAGVPQVAIVQMQAALARVRVGVERLQPPGVERAGPADNPMHLVPFGDEQLGQVRAILPGNARNQCLLHLGSSKPLIGQERAAEVPPPGPRRKTRLRLRRFATPSPARSPTLRFSARRTGGFLGSAHKDERAGLPASIPP